MKKNLKKEKKNKMKVYKYDNITLISVKTDTKDKLFDIKLRYGYKNMNDVIERLIRNSEELEYINKDPYEKYNS